MTLNQALAAAKTIDQVYLEPVCSVIRQDIGGDGLSLSHLRWMVSQMHRGMSNNKVMRWLGWIQGVLVSTSNCTLLQMKELSRAAANDELPVQRRAKLIDSYR
jgi:hypothetical protein